LTRNWRLGVVQKDLVSSRRFVRTVSDEGTILGECRKKKRAHKGFPEEG